MKSIAGTLAAPFPYFGGKANACAEVWRAFAEVDNYVEPFCGSAAMLLGAPDDVKRTETINDADGFVANFWRAIAADADSVAEHADWPTNEVDLFSRHSWLVRQRDAMLDALHADPAWYDAKIAGWWCWGACNWIGSGWCSGDGPWVHDGSSLVDNRQLPHLGNAGRGAYIRHWFGLLQARLRDVRVGCGDWSRVLTDSVTVRHGTTAVFLDPPYTKGAMDYAAGGVGGAQAGDVRAWCADNGTRKAMRIVLCGHAGEHDELLDRGWTTRTWTARAGYATTKEALENSASETLWCSPHCAATGVIADLFTEGAT